MKIRHANCTYYISINFGSVQKRVVEGEGLVNEKRLSVMHILHASTAINASDYTSSMNI